MLAVFLLQNQYDQYLSKSGEWLDGADSKTLYRTVHKDEVINQKVEVAVKQADTRAKIVNGFQLPNGQVMLPQSEPLPITPEPETHCAEELSSDSSLNEEESFEETIGGGNEHRDDTSRAESLIHSNSDKQQVEETPQQLLLSGEVSKRQFTT